MQGNLSNHFGIESYEKVGVDSSDMLLGNKTPSEVVIKSPMKDIPNLDLIPFLIRNIIDNNVRVICFYLIKKS